MSKKSNAFQILHISDLHVSTDKEFDRKVVLDPLLEILIKDREKNFRPEIVVITGDLAWKGKKEEYAKAEEFLTDLRNVLRLEKEQFFIVPGNHDVDRKKYRPTDVPVYKDMRALNDELENEDFRADLLKGMNDYFSFIETHYPHLTPFEKNLVPFITSIAPKGGGRVGLVGLNSAWMCRKKLDEREIAIGEYQVSRAMRHLKELGEYDLVMIMFHHPLDWLWPKDKDICRSYFNESLLLCGHLHSLSGGYFQDYDGRFIQLQAGACYLGSDSDRPVRFQYVTVELPEKTIRLDFRRFYPGNRKWDLDGEIGDGGKKVFELIPSEREVKKKIAEPRAERPELYMNWIISNYGSMDADRLYGKGDAFPLKLPEIFIPLMAYAQESKRTKGLEMEDKRDPVDIEEIAAKAEHLLIEGQAGSGKTTLLKHMTYCLARKDNKSCKIDSSEELLPLLILLKDLNGFFDDPRQAGRNGSDALLILDWYFKERLSSLIQLDQAEAFLKQKRAVLLLDGLDELLPDYRDLVINAFADLVIKYGGNRLICTSRPHGIEGAVVKRLGDRHIKILSLNMDQVNLFINRWFVYLYPGSSGIGGKNAQAMISEIKTHPAIEQLIDNPLMLTAICILYHDEKELPGQRAELYKKFIDNMLYRRFKDPGNVHAFLSLLAIEMHTRKVRSVDKSFIQEILRKVYKQEEDETEKAYKKRIDRLFEDIEPKCGLLKLEGGQYAFWHLTFQEFLTAQYLVENSTDYIGAIASYWGDDWYKEVIELYIGYLSMDNKAWANDIIEDIIKNKDNDPFKKWLLASEALLDIQKGKRIPLVEDKARKRMIELIEIGPGPKIQAQAGEILGWLGDTRDLKEFVSIEGGKYELENRGKINISPFQIGRYPVVNAWFEEFIRAGGYRNREYWSPEGRKWQEHTGAQHPRFWDNRKWRCPNSPVVGVCWYEAHAFTRWLTVTRADGYTYRLLSEDEWQAAAAGKEKRTYPWGDKWEKHRCNSRKLNLEKISSVGIFLEGRTPEGIGDLAGNVWEWTWSDYHARKELADFHFDNEIQVILEELEKNRDEKKLKLYGRKLTEKKRSLPVLRGGSWRFDSVYCRCAARSLGYDPNGRLSHVGFRCARS
jgi:formylglycine-generating enzyme required for sulfatase activity/predicted MPP superfamily phosphohydrolase/energy-coupling factor transporter ATP-binding protein EcfA2